MLEPRSLRHLSVEEAGAIWMQMRAMQNLKPATHEITRNSIRALSRFFGDLPLSAITPGHLREYQVARERNEVLLENGVVHPWKQAAGSSCINHELNKLKQMLDLAGLWERIAPWYAPRPIPGWSPREIPTADEAARIFDRGASDPAAELALWVATITANTSASGSELRFMRLRHLTLVSPLEDGRSWIWIPEEGCKNNARPRKIPLNDDARWAFEQVYARALRLGSCEPDHFLFPFRSRRNAYDPARPATKSWVRKSWSRLREVTGLEHLSPHDLRHLFCSRALEAGVRPEVVRSLMGHKSQKMTDYYSRVEMEPKTAAVDLLLCQGMRKPPAREKRVAQRSTERLISIRVAGRVT
ncbi:MAG: tyrosine-type recombinase/integrase [Patescibacteria group bacterium]|nr:tyrosine-type recombinase/integrase [Patescibacteria group bacterium]